MDDLVNFYKDGNKLPNTLSGSLELIDLLYSRIKQLENDLSGYKKGVDLLKIEDTQHIERIKQLEIDSKKALDYNVEMILKVEQLESDLKDQHNHWTKIMNEKDDKIEQLKKDLKEIDKVTASNTSYYFKSMESRKIARKALEDKDV